MTLRILASLEQREGYVHARIYEATDDELTLVAVREGKASWVARAVTLAIGQLARKSARGWS